jgi:hypothetical protein
MKKTCQILRVTGNNDDPDDFRPALIKRGKSMSAMMMIKPKLTAI